MSLDLYLLSRLHESSLAGSRRKFCSLSFSKICGHTEKSWAAPSALLATATKIDRPPVHILSGILLGLVVRDDLAHIDLEARCGIDRGSCLGATRRCVQLACDSIWPSLFALPSFLFFMTCQSEYPMQIFFIPERA